MTIILDKYRKCTKISFIKDNMVELITENVELFNIIENKLNDKVDFFYKTKNSDRHILMENCEIIKISNHKDEIYTIRFKYGKNIHMDLKELRLFKLKNYILND